MNDIKSQEIKLGRIFLKKYNVIFNSDSKMMTFYQINNNQNNNKTGVVENNEKKEEKNKVLVVFSYIFIGLLFLSIGLYLGRKYCLYRRKKYANELDDNDFDYEPKQKEDDNNRKLIDL